MTETIIETKWESVLNPNDQALLREKVYNILLLSIDCGPFDGGCLTVAKALSLALGGQVVVLVNEDSQAEHAALSLNDHLIDFDGPAAPDAFISRFNRQEIPFKPIVGYRPVMDGDLPDAPDEPTTIALLAEVFSKTFTIDQRQLEVCESGDALEL